MVDSYETHNMYPNFSETPLNIPLNDQQHFRLNKINKLKIVLLLRLNKEN